ncbi:MAG: class I SAM-dependent methyltransferase [Candidatus Omnitrophica bacterium]|nr:class I SAM-dependent methyltransferase [Candidatus Omnitrophota bacterium]
MEKYSKVLKRLPRGDSVLEIGCHTGYFSRLMLDGGYDVLGIERDPEAAGVACADNIPVICGDIEDPAIILSLNRKFDMVLFMDVLEHLNNPADALKRTKSVLNKSGRIIITGPNIAYWAARKELLLGRKNRDDCGMFDKTHLHFYTASSWRSLVEGAGYMIKLFEPAEGFIPFEHIFKKIPLISFITGFIHDAALRYMPGLFASAYLIEAGPE